MSAGQDECWQETSTQAQAEDKHKQKICAGEQRQVQASRDKGGWAETRVERQDECKQKLYEASIVLKITIYSTPLFSQFGFFPGACSPHHTSQGHPVPFLNPFDCHVTPPIHCYNYEGYSMLYGISKRLIARLINILWEPQSSGLDGLKQTGQGPGHASRLG